MAEREACRLRRSCIIIGIERGLRQAVRWQLVARNVAEAVEPPTPKYRKIAVLQEDEFVHLLDAAKGTRLYIPILLAGTTATRRGEIWMYDGARSRSLLQSAQAGALQNPGSADVHGRSAGSVRQAQGELKYALADGNEGMTSFVARMTAGFGHPQHSRQHIATSCGGERSRTSAFTTIVIRTPPNFCGTAKIQRWYRNDLDILGSRSRLKRYGHVVPGMEKDAATRADGKLRSAFERRQQVATGAGPPLQISKRLANGCFGRQR